MNQLKLHEATIEVLKSFPDCAATANQITKCIKQHSQYKKHNGNFPDQN